MTSYKNQNYKQDMIKIPPNCDFVNCSFENIVFESVNLEDVRFIDCTFIHTKFKNGEFKNVEFLNCKHANTEILDVELNNTVFDNDSVVDGAYGVWIRGSYMSHVVFKNLLLGVFDILKYGSSNHTMRTMLPHLTVDQRWKKGGVLRRYYNSFIHTHIDKQKEMIDGKMYDTLHYPISLPKKNLELFCELHDLPKPPWVNNSVLKIIDGVLNG